MTYAHKVEKHEAQVDWSQQAAAIVRRIRAFDPFPGASSVLDGETVKLWAAQVQAGRCRRARPARCWPSARRASPSPPATPSSLVTELQRPGGKRLAAADFLRGFDMQARAGLRPDVSSSPPSAASPNSARACATCPRCAVGIGAWGLMTGVAMVKSGMSVFESVAMTLLVYAGSSQLAAIPLLIAGAPAWVILATGFCVNLRFVVFSLHLRPYLMHMPRWRRLTHGYLTADMSYALFTGRYPQPPATDGRAARRRRPT